MYTDNTWKNLFIFLDTEQFVIEELQRKKRAEYIEQKIKILIQFKSQL